MSAKIKYLEYFTDEESIYLLAGEMLYGRKWQKILTIFKDKFKTIRTRSTLVDRFETLHSPRNKSLLKKLLPLAREISNTFNNKSTDKPNDKENCELQQSECSIGN